LNALGSHGGDGLFAVWEKKSPLRLKAIRQAINYAFDREKMVRFFRNNTGIPATASFIPPGLAAYNPRKVRGYS
jgi:peptide/nickel transport system substrate-binding protein